MTGGAFKRSGLPRRPYRVPCVFQKPRSTPPGILLAMLQGFSSATGRPSAAEPPCRKDWPSGGICAFRRRLQDPGVTQVMRLPVLSAFPRILFSLSFVGDVPSPRGTAIVPIAMGQPLSRERQVSVAMESSFSLSLQAFSQDPGLFLPLGLSPGPCGLLCSFPEAFLRHHNSLCHCECFSVTTSPFSVT